MSSFFSIPSSKKRKTTTSSEKPRKRIAGAAPARTPAKAASSKSAAPAKKQEERDESISGSDIDDDESIGSAAEDEGSDDGSESDRENETAAERRLRLAENYLSNISKEIQEEVGFDARDVDRELLAERIQLDVSEAKGRVYRTIADQLAFDTASHCYFKNNSESWTSVALRAPYAYTTTKDLYVHKWRIQDLPKDQWPQTKKKKSKSAPPPPKKKPELEQWIKGNAFKHKEPNYKRHLDRILCVAVSSDGKFVVTGGEDKRIIVYEADTLKPLKAFTHHRDAVTGLAFRRGTNQLYSCSKDRTVKVWSLDELAYVETLFGHQDEVVDIDALAQERCVSVGARDRTARLWKVADETQLVFRGGGNGVDKKNPVKGVDPRSLSHEGSMDCVSMIDDELFVTGSDNGALALWSLTKKKPLHTIPLAHGLETPLLPSEASAEKEPKSDIVPPPFPRWITALRTVPYSDLILSGSWDGYIRVWKLSDDKRKLESRGVLCGGKALAGEEAGEATQAEPLIKGIINSIAVCERGERAKDGICIVAAVGTQHKSGKWSMGSKLKAKGKNGGFVFEVARSVPLQPEANGEGHEDEDMDSD
ncbi:ribosomal RNA-processing protein [Plectosphaerella plurivora]|uniref:Ribosomal RNA-processing protein n=1 Tax=Plectosphaerella plurivora TaxID=936078 RepID=A0A9P9AE89_9PEZI|nr:ribosomal RNA-processing protein [Plectosphaerella plurivora]